MRRAALLSVAVLTLACAGAPPATERRASPPPPAPLPEAKPATVERRAPFVIASEPPTAGDVGTSGFTWLVAAAADGQWALVCETRKDTDRDGKIEALWGMHGELFGDEPAPFLNRDGKSEEIEELVAVDPQRRHLVVMRNKKMELLNVESGARAILRAADTRFESGAFHGARAAFDPSGEHVFYVRQAGKKGDRRKIVVRRSNTDEEREIDPGPGALVSATVSSEWVVARVFEAQPGHSYTTSSRGGPEHTVGGRRCRADRAPTSSNTEPRWAPTTGGVAGADKHVVLAMGAARVVRAEDGALSLVKGPESQPLAPAGCEGIVLARSAAHESLLFACEKGGDPAELRPLWFWRNGKARALGLKVEVASDRLALVGGSGSRVAQVRTEEGDALVDMANGRTHPTEGSLRATLAGTVLTERTSKTLAVFDFAADETVVLPGEAPYLMVTAEQGRLFAGGPRGDDDSSSGLLIDLEAMVVLGKFAGTPLAVSGSGWVLARAKGSAAVPRWLRPEP